MQLYVKKVLMQQHERQTQESNFKLRDKFWLESFNIPLTLRQTYQQAFYKQGLLLKAAQHFMKDL